MALLRELVAEAETGGIETIGVVSVGADGLKTAFCMGDQDVLVCSLEQLKLRALLSDDDEDD